MAASNEVTLRVAGRTWGGWQSVHVVRGIEIMPSAFDVTLTERYPDQVDEAFPHPGDVVQVLIDDDLVITGYVDRYVPGIAPSGHQLRVVGRGACSDLVDCSAMISSQQIMGKKLLDIAKLLADPHDIDVRQLSSATSQLAGISDGAVPLVGVQLTQTPYEIIETIARWLALLVYEDTDGALVISAVGTKRMASGIKTGVNAQVNQAIFATDQRYSEIIGVPTAVDGFLQIRQGMPAPVAYQVPSIVKISDPTMASLKTIKGNPRYRPLVLVSEQGYAAADITKQRVAWEVARRAGRSQVISVIADNWRDSAGTLWTPNALIAVDAPECKVSGATWLIAEVEFAKDLENGTAAHLTLMPPEAFKPAPPPYGIDWAVVEAGRAIDTGGNGH